MRGTIDNNGNVTITGYDSYYDSKNSVVFPINLMGGYQWYFYNRPWFHLGVAIKAHIGYTNYNEEFYDSYYDGSGRWFASEITAHGIQYGLEAKFLWDFLNKGNHTLGVSVAPLGFEGSSIIYNDNYDFSVGNNATKTHSGNYEKGTKTTFTYTFSGGLHYYYDINHQLFIYYKYRFYSDIMTGKTRYVFAPSHTLMTGYAYKF